MGRSATQARQSGRRTAKSSIVRPAYGPSVDLGLLAERPFVPPGVRVGRYTVSCPLIKPSRLTSKRRGGSGKQLSSGWALNFAVGCIHGCIFCYVDSIHKRYGESRYGSIVRESWGNYLLIPSNMEDAIEKTPWRKWKGEEILLSSTHDPYIPQLARITRGILERALSSGVRFCIQTRSPLVLNDFDLLTKYRDRIRLQVSIATMDSVFSRLVEPRVASPKVRLNILRRAKKRGIETGVILGPIFPPLKARPDVDDDLETMMTRLKEIEPDNIYGECIHIRGKNISAMEDIMGEAITDLHAFDLKMKSLFRRKLKEHDLKGTWWPEHMRIRRT